MRTIFPKITGLALSLLFIASCAPVSLVNTWRNPDAPGQRFHKLLVISMAPDPVARQLFEEVLVADLRVHGIEAIPGSSRIPAEAKPERKIIEKAVREAGADGIIALQMNQTSRETTVEPGYSVTYVMGWYPDMFSSWDFYNYYDATSYYVPPTVTTSITWMVRATFFDASTAKLLWAGTFKAGDPEKYIAISKDISRTVINKLVQDGLI